MRGMCVWFFCHIYCCWYCQFYHIGNSLCQYWQSAKVYLIFASFHMVFHEAFKVRYYLWFVLMTFGNISPDRNVTLFVSLSNNVVYCKQAHTKQHVIVFWVITDGRCVSNVLKLDNKLLTKVETWKYLGMTITWKTHIVEVHYCIFYKLLWKLSSHVLTKSYIVRLFINNLLYR